MIDYSFFKENESVNYCFESGNKSGIYNFVNKFINAHAEILTLNNINEIESFILPPSAYDDNKNRSKQEYDDVMNTFNNIKMLKIQELGNQKTA
ncbi:MAG: hypothetical protein J6D28_05910 [Bacilli bacterium]|nr:hypothetical protein [Bacilli bacterium]